MLSEDFRRTRRHCANCLQHFFVAVAICRLAFINRLDPTPPLHRHPHPNTFTASVSPSAPAVDNSDKSKSPKTGNSAPSVVSRESRVDIILWRHSKHIHQRRIYMKSLMRGRHCCRQDATGETTGWACRAKRKSVRARQVERAGNRHLPHCFLIVRLLAFYFRFVSQPLSVSFFLPACVLVSLFLYPLTIENGKEGILNLCMYVTE